MFVNSDIGFTHDQIMNILRFVKSIREISASSESKQDSQWLHWPSDAHSTEPVLDADVE